MHPLRVAVFGVFALLSACGRSTTIGGIVDAGPPDTLTINGRACTEPADPTGFPVKVVLLIDQSGSMCVSDPPGSQQSAGFCEQWGNVPPGITQPGRVSALNRFLDGIGSLPNVEVALVPYDTNVRGVWPSLRNFARPDATLRNRVNILQAELGNSSDLQGALAFTRTLIANDIALTEASIAEVLPHTRYVVMLFTDGPPSPRCAQRDSLPTYADDLNPVGIWPDTHPDFCNTNNTNDPIAGFVPGTDRNQTYQLQAEVDGMRGNASAHHVGGFAFHTVMVSNADAFTNCGVACQDLFGDKFRWPGRLPAVDKISFSRAEGRALLQELSAGVGTFLELTSQAAVTQFRFDLNQLESLASLNVVRTLHARQHTATARNGAWVVDSDGDGLSDDEEAVAGTQKFFADTDGDGFDDFWEERHRDLQFDPLVKDLRGCDPNAPATPGCEVRDFDGDGLSQFAEAFFGTNGLFADTDRDGFDDGEEVRAGLNPLSPLTSVDDSDLDGVPDAIELLRGSQPLVADPGFPGMSIQLGAAQTQDDNSVCHDFTVSGIPLVDAPAGPSPDLKRGTSLISVSFGAVPERTTESVGVWQVACLYARRDVSVTPPLQVPADLLFSLDSSTFGRFLNIKLPETYCVGRDAANRP